MCLYFLAAFKAVDLGLSIVCFFAYYTDALRLEYGGAVSFIFCISLCAFLATRPIWSCSGFFASYADAFGF